MAELILYLIVAAGLAAIPASLVGWTAWIVCWWKGQPLLPAEPRRPVPWGVAEVIVTIGVLILAQNLCMAAAVAAGWVPAPAEEGRPPTAGEMGVIAASEMITIALAVTMILRWSGGRMSDVGFSLRGIGRDIAVGLAATGMLLPPVLGVQAAVTQFIPYEHPVLDMLQGASGRTVFAAFFTAVVIGPLAEEFFFRVLLQGWLQRVAIGRRAKRATGEEARELTTEHHSPPQEGHTAEGHDGEGAAPEDRFSSSRHTTGATAIDPLPAAVVPPAWPILVSSACFALLHWGQGPAPVSLFFLACGLGYLYRQTGRIWAPLVVHVVLNALTLTVALLSQMVEIPGTAP